MPVARLLLLLPLLPALALWPQGPRRLETDPALDCGVRALALEFAQSLFPSQVGAPGAPAPASLIFDALRLGSQCNASRALLLPPQAHPPPPPPPPPLRGGGQPAFFIDAKLGSDSNAGTQAAPFQSLARGLRASRGAPAAARLVLRDSAPFYLPAPLQLTAADSGLALGALPGEAPVLSGGAPLAGLAWAFVRNVSSGGMAGPYEGLSVVSNIPGLQPGGSVPGVVAFFGDTAAVGACAAGCAADAACSSYTWHDGTCGAYANNCFFRIDGSYEPTSGWPGHFAGQKVPITRAAIYKAALPPGTPRFTNLFRGESEGGRRLVRARHPNGNPEEGTGGFAAGALAWAPPRAYPPPQDLKVASPQRAGDPFFPQWQWGVGGTCAQFEPAEGFWCSSDPPAGSTYRVPSGVTLAPGAFPGAWENAAADGALLHAFHALRWGDWKFSVAAADAASGNVTFASGGFQEARGAASGDTFFMEGVADFLDAPGEWHLAVGEGAAGTLYLALNASDAAPGASTVLVAPLLDALLRAEGSSDAPVANLSVEGVTLAHTAPTFMKPFAMPSGGDFSVRLDAALVLRGTVGARVRGCSFVGLGGNALLLRGFNRAAEVSGSLFRFVGDSAIVSIGEAEGMDGTAQEVPAGTLVAGNVGAELGLYVKQSGFYYHALSMNATVTGNAFFNIPRAGVNVNDGFGGGNVIERNLCFNAVRETSDHGCYNSWDRAPLIWDPSDVTRLYPALTSVSRNFFINNYHSTWPVDQDDGSNNQSVAFNLLLWGGAKNYLGFDKHFNGNLYLYPDANMPTAREREAGGPLRTGFSPFCYLGNGAAAFPAGVRDSWVNETCFASAGGSLYSSDCSPASPLDGNLPFLANNSLFLDTGAYVLDCGGQKWSLQEAQAKGVDVGTSVAASPGTPQLLALLKDFMVKNLL